MESKPFSSPAKHSFLSRSKLGLQFPESPSRNTALFMSVSIGQKAGIQTEREVTQFTSFGRSNLWMPCMISCLLHQCTRADFFLRGDVWSPESVNQIWGVRKKSLRVCVVGKGKIEKLILDLSFLDFLLEACFGPSATQVKDCHLSFHNA